VYQPPASTKPNKLVTYKPLDWVIDIRHIHQALPTNAAGELNGREVCLSCRLRRSCSRSKTRSCRLPSRMGVVCSCSKFLSNDPITHPQSHPHIYTYARTAPTTCGPHHVPLLLLFLRIPLHHHTPYCLPHNPLLLHHHLAWPWPAAQGEPSG